MKQNTNSPNPIQVSKRLFAVLELLSQTDAIGLLDLSNSLSLHKSTTHRLLNSLIHLGYVRQDAETHKYRLTFKIVNIANNMICNLDILDSTRPYLKQLMESTGETVHLVQLDGNNAVYINKFEAHQNSIQMVSKIGNQIPLYCSGVGKAIAAELPLDTLKQIWDTTKIKKATPHTIVSFSSLLEELEKIRTLGYAIDNEENELGVRCIATALPAYNGQPPYAFSISAPTSRMDDQTLARYAKLVIATKKELSQTN